MVIATGFFDGVHIGHRMVIRQLVDAAAARGDESMVITFWPHPRNVLQQEARSFRLLTGLEQKRKMLLELGVDRVEVLDFTREFSRMTAEEYLSMLKERYGAAAVLIGYDNRMGSDAKRPSEVAAVAQSLGLEVIRTEAVRTEPGYEVSSTMIRNLLAEGDVVGAGDMLGYRYSVQGVVVAGNRLGRTIGFPTANIRLYDPLKMVPGDGVYFVEVETLEKTFYGMCNIGCKPTVASGNARTIETNIFGLDEDIYGLDMKITFIRKLRNEVRFGSLEELRVQLEADRDSLETEIKAIWRQ